ALGEFRVSDIGCKLRIERVVVGQCASLDAIGEGRGDTNNRRSLADEWIEDTTIRIQSAVDRLPEQGAHGISAVYAQLIEALVDEPGIIAKAADETVVLEI